MAGSRRPPLDAQLVIGSTIIGFWLICALFGPWLEPFDPLRSSVALMLPLSRDLAGLHWLGTDILGRDILSRLIGGTRAVLLWSALATSCAYIAGVSAGMLAGYLGRATDRALCFLADVMLSFPVLVLYLLIIVRLGASGINIILAVTFASAPAIFRIVRALVMGERERDYVRVCVTQGEPLWRILISEILPNVTRPLAVDACLRLGYTAITIGLLGFLGLGLPPPAPDWGGMINEGRGMAIAFPHLIVFPCLAISTLMLGLSMISDGLALRSQRLRQV